MQLSKMEKWKTLAIVPVSITNYGSLFSVHKYLMSTSYMHKYCTRCQGHRNEKDLFLALEELKMYQTRHTTKQVKTLQSNVHFDGGVTCNTAENPPRGEKETKFWTCLSTACCGSARFACPWSQACQQRSSAVHSFSLEGSIQVRTMNGIEMEISRDLGVSWSHQAGETWDRRKIEARGQQPLREEVLGVRTSWGMRMPAWPRSHRPPQMRGCFQNVSNFF